MPKNDGKLFVGVTWAMSDEDFWSQNLRVIADAVNSAEEYGTARIMHEILNVSFDDDAQKGQVKRLYTEFLAGISMQSKIEVRGVTMPHKNIFVIHLLAVA